jgi:hypothetical protein
MILLLLASPAQRLRLRVVQAAGLCRRLERDGRPGWSGGVMVVRVVRRQGGAVAELRRDAPEVVAEGQCASVSLRRLTFCLILLKFIITTVGSLKLSG